MFLMPVVDLCPSLKVLVVYVSGVDWLADFC